QNLPPSAAKLSLSRNEARRIAVREPGLEQRRTGSHKPYTNRKGARIPLGGKLSFNNASPNYFAERPAKIIGCGPPRHRQSKLMLGAALPPGPHECAVI